MATQKKPNIPVQDQKGAEVINVSIDQKAVPLLPHERDQSTLGQVNPIDPVIKQAAKDIAKGLKDTDRGEEANRVYQKQKTKK